MAADNGVNAYRADIDGLRAVAVLAVIAYHGDPSWMPGGYLGVDVFFVISGFLITSIIFPEMRDGHFKFGGFLLRRMRRLYPALVVMLLASALAGVMFLSPEEGEDFGETLATAAVFASNFMFMSEASYFDPEVEFQPLLHTWSLGVEEQFYLLWPLALAFVVGLKRPKMLGVLVVLLGGASFVLFLWLSESRPSAAFYLLPTRVWELMCGAGLALAVIHRGHAQVFSKPRITWLFFGSGILALGMSLGGVLTTGSGAVFAPLVACLGASLLIMSGVRSDGGVPRVLGCQPLVGIGLISYSLYLWHWPVLTFAKHALVRPLTTLETLTLLAAATLAAYLSWRWVERPFRGSLGRMSNPGFLKTAGGLAMVPICAGLALDQTDGWPERFAEDDLQMIANAPVSERRECVGLDPTIISSRTLCRLGHATANPTAILWGDSHAAGLAPGLGKRAARHGVTLLSATNYGCAPLAGVRRVKFDPKRPCYAFNAAVMQTIIMTSNVHTVVLSGRWASAATGRGFGLEGHRATFLEDDFGSATTETENIQVFQRGIRSTVQQLVGAGRRVILIDSIPEPGIKVPELLLKQRQRGIGEPPTLERAAFEERQAPVVRVFQSQSFARLIKRVAPVDLLCGLNSCAVAHEGYPLYSDTNHLSRQGVEHIAPLLDEVVDFIVAGAERRTR